MLNVNYKITFRNVTDRGIPYLLIHTHTRMHAHTHKPSLTHLQKQLHMTTRVHVHEQ